MTSHGILYTSSDDGSVKQLPLDKVIIEALVVDLSARVDVIQRFYNDSKTPTSRAKYVFPVPAGAAVCAFEMRTADRHIVTGEVKEKTHALAEHEDAIRFGKTTALLDWVSGDLFTISLGPIPGEQSVTTTISYVMDLMDDGHEAQVRLFIPMSVGERYGEPPQGMEDASAVTEQTRVRFQINIQMQGSIKSVMSPTHQAELTVEPYRTHLGRASQHRAIAKLRSKKFLTQDFVLLIDAVGLDRPRCFAEYDNQGAKTVAMQMMLIPKFEIPPLLAQEYLFLVDRSGSMHSERIATAKRALVMLLRILPSGGTKFNVFSFGSKCDSHWQQSLTYSQQTLSDMTNHVDGMDADYGGTEICSALQKTFAARDATIPTVVFVLTDGESHNVDATASVVRSTVSRAVADAPLRVFVLGIGSTVSTDMCEAIAQAGNGTYLMATAAESIVSKCATLLRAGRSFVLRDVSVDWGVQAQHNQADHPDLEVRLALDGQTFRQSPSQLPALYPDLRLKIFALIRGDSLAGPSGEPTLPREVILHAQRDVTGETLNFRIPVEQVKFETENTHTPLIHTLAARRIIQELEALGQSNTKLRAEQSKDAIIRLGVQYQLASRYTSFVAIDHTTHTDAAAPPQLSQTLRAARHRRLPEDAIPQDFRRGSRAAKIANDQPPMQSAVNYAASFSSAFFQTWFGPPTNRVDGSRSDGPSHIIPGDAGHAFGGGADSDDGQESTGDEGDGPEGYETDETFSTMSSLMASVTSTSSSWSDAGSRPPSPTADDHPRSPSPIVVVPNMPPCGAAGIPRPPTPSPTPLDTTVDELFRLQSSDGSFTATPEFVKLVGSDAIDQGRTLGHEPTLWATALAAAYMKRRMRSHPQMLEGIMDKILEYVSNRLSGSSAARFARIVQEASAMLPLEN